MGLAEVVAEARASFESATIPNSELEHLYSSYAEIDDVASFISRSKSLFPALNCGLASVYLKYKLGRGLIVQGTYDGHSHTFLVYDHDTIIDITADQYGGPAVYVGPLCSPWSREPGSE